MHDLTEDSLWRGRITLWQPRAGYRFNLDPLMLAGFLRPGENLLELGAGCGVLSILALRRRTFARAWAIEVQPVLLEASRRNREANDLSKRLHIVEADLSRGNFASTLTDAPEHGFDCVAFNPPYFRQGEGRANKNASRDIARREGSATLADFVRRAAENVHASGSLCAIVPISRADELTGLSAEHGFGVERTCLLRTTDSRPPSLALFSARKGTIARAPHQSERTLHVRAGNRPAPAGRLELQGWLQEIVDGP